MKNQYFGDINDYRKYGLLRALQSEGGGKLLVSWMLTLDDGSRDGGFRSYTQEPDRWARFDPELFAGLRNLLERVSQPRVSLIEGSGLLPRTAYYSKIVPDARQDRDMWCRNLLEAASKVDFVFVDPDTGVEIASRPIGRKGSSKYVAWREIEGIWNVGCSVLIYQHFRREPREAFAERMESELRRRTGARFTQSFRTPHVLFLLAAQVRHEARFQKAVTFLHQNWAGQINPIRLDTVCESSYVS